VSCDISVGSPPTTLPNVLQGSLYHFFPRLSIHLLGMSVHWNGVISEYRKSEENPKKKRFKESRALFCFHELWVTLMLPLNADDDARDMMLQFTNVH